MNTDIRYMLDNYNVSTEEEVQNAFVEIVQQTVLLALSKAQFFRRAAFYGGTALRLFYGLKRFSEDLDFTALNDRFSGFKHVQASIEETLKAYGFEFQLQTKLRAFKSPIESAFIKGNTSINLLTVGLTSRSHPAALTKIKLELDTQPAMGFDFEPKLLTSPQSCYVATLNRASLFAC